MSNPRFYLDFYPAGSHCKWKGMDGNWYAGTIATEINLNSRDKDLTFPDTYGVWVNIDGNRSISVLSWRYIDDIRIEFQLIKPSCEHTGKIIEMVYTRFCADCEKTI